MNQHLDNIDKRLLAAIEAGLPLSPAPFAEIGARVGLSEADVIARLKVLCDGGIIKRFGVVVRHRELGYVANAMVVWDVPDAEIAEIGSRMAKFDFVTLCYQRPRRLPDWPYNLFCMVHGRERDHVLEQVEMLARKCGLENTPRDALFSKRRFKQRGAHYFGAHSAQTTMVGE